MKYVYPAVFTPSEDGSYAVNFPDIPRCFTCGDTLVDAIEMAEDVLAMVLCGMEDDKEPIPLPSVTLVCESPETVSLIKADTTAYRRINDSRAVKKTLTIPAWLNHAAEAAHVNFSSVLQDALKAHLELTG